MLKLLTVVTTCYNKMDTTLNYLSVVPDEIVFDIALDASMNDIYNLCQLESRFNYLLCNNERFWKEKFIRDYGYIPETNKMSWKELYEISMNTLYIYGYISSNVRYAKMSNADHSIVFIDGNAKKFQVNSTNPRMTVKALSVSCGDKHIMYIDLHHNLWGIGENLYGQLGLGDSEKRHLPEIIPGIKAKYVSAGTYHTGVIDMNNYVWMMGGNYSDGRLGVGSNDYTIVIPTRINSYRSSDNILHNEPIKCKQISCGFVSKC